MIAGCFKKYFCFFSVSVAIFAAFFVLVSPSFGQEAPGGPTETEIYDREKAIQIVSESGGPGGCDSEATCDAFCNTPTNQKTCMDWALVNGVISQENHSKYSGFASEGGPGGCKTPDACKSYCENESNFDECLEFGQKQGLISEEQVQRAKKTGPGGCRTQKDCQAFCENPSNHDVCIEHAVQEGFMSKEEAQRIKEFTSKAEEFRRKADEFRRQAEEFERPEIEEIDPGFDEDRAKQILATQGGPGGCKTFDECEDFCENPDNQLTCFEFAEKNNLFTNQEHAEKIKRIMQEGGPGGCRGERACRQFCENEANFEICLEFAQKHDLLPPGEVERARKGIEALREGGPAGCRGPQECEKVCQDPANQGVCFEWAKKHGLISEEEVRFMEEANKIREEFESKRHEFETRPPEGFKPPEGFHPPGEFLGPKEGCTGADECRREYCSKPEHQKECEEGFKTPPGSQPPGFGGTLPPTEIRPGEEGVVCVQVFDPVCGSDGRTYSNECEAHRTGTPVKYKGKCEFDNYPGPTNHVCPLIPEFECPAEQYKKYNITSDGCQVSECVPGISSTPSPNPTIDPSLECANHGGTWTGTECKLSSPQPTSLRNHLFLGAMLRYLLR